MKYKSTGNSRAVVDLKTAVLQAMPADGGLYFPVEIPRMSRHLFRSIHRWSLPEISVQVATAFFGDDLSVREIRKIVEESVNFPAPLVAILPGIYALELFHGPTLAFKDFGARFMSRLMALFIRGQNRKLNVLVATSGDTGSAVAHGFHRVEGINVVILYPAGKISGIQEKQMTTLGDNITALRVQGSFDDCQRLVKRALGDPEVRQNLQLTSANSINISRLIPQVFYYFWILGQADFNPEMKLLVSVPCGNFGNLTAGLLAKAAGLPITRFVAATNVNDTVVRYLQTGRYTPRTAVPTLSNAMDVGDPSNFVRIQELYNYSHRRITDDVSARSFNDRQTRSAIGALYRDTGYICDPHGAVGYLGLQWALDQNPGVDRGVFLETAHPAKFSATVEAVINAAVPVPNRLQRSLSRPVLAREISPDFSAFREWLLSVRDYR